jgi:5-methylcytosine-specific restriction endonuclease McrA
LKISLNSTGSPLSLLPISAVNWHLSIKLLVLDKFKVLDEYEDWVIHSPSTEMKVPAVMIAKKYLNLARHPKFSRGNVYLRDLFTCQYCGCEHEWGDLTLDHVLPRAKGGISAWDNIVTACHDCNISKGDDNISPMKNPYRPHYWELANKRAKFPVNVGHHSWKKYLKWNENLINVA